MIPRFIIRFASAFALGIIGSVIGQPATCFGKDVEILTATERCENGSYPNSCYLVGDFWKHNGNAEKAGSYYKLGCDKDDPLSCALYAEWAAAGNQKTLAIELYDKSCRLYTGLGTDKLYCTTADILRYGPEKVCTEGTGRSCEIAGGTALKENNKKLAIQLFSKGCEKNSSRSCTALANLLKERGDKKGSYKVLLKACEGEDRYYACAQAAEFALEQKENDRAIELFKLSCDKTNAQACLRLGWVFLKMGNTEEATTHFKAACGPPWRLAWACGMVSYLQRGLSTERDIRQTVINGCQKGNGEDCYYQSNIEIFDRPGDHAAQDRATLLEDDLLLKSCELGYGLACNRFATKHTGDKDRNFYIVYYEKGCDAGDGASCMRAKQSGSARTNLDELGCRYGDQQACLELGFTVLETDFDKAREYLEKGCRGGSSVHCTRLARAAIDQNRFAEAKEFVHLGCDSQIKTPFGDCASLREEILKISKDMQEIVPVAGACKRVQREVPPQQELGYPAQKYTDFEVKSPTVRVITHSSACKPSQTKGFLRFLLENSKMKDQFSDGFHLELYSCTLLSNTGAEYGLALVQATVKTKPQKNALGWKVLAMLRVDAAGNPEEDLKEIVSVQSHYDMRSDSKITRICDVDDDGLAEVIVENVLYAGKNGTIFHFDRDYQAVREEYVAGYGWD